MNCPQLEMIEKVRRSAEDDADISAVLMYGSFVKGEGDGFSDIEFYLFQRRATDPEAWAARIRPLRLFFKNEFGTEVAIFDNLIRGEFHFHPVEDIDLVREWDGLTSFEWADRMALVDKDGLLARALAPISRLRPRHDDPEHIGWLAESLLNNLLMVKNVLARGERAHAHQGFQHLHKYLLGLVRLAAGADHHWENPAKGLEKEIGADWYQAYAECAADLTPGRLEQALEASFRLAGRLFAGLGVAGETRALLADIADFKPGAGTL